MDNDTAMTAEGLRVKLRLSCDGVVVMGPGKAELLELVHETGSIAAAGRRMGMSYRRAWSLVHVMNAGFQAPLVECARGGAKGGGATLTATGHEVLALFRRAERLSRASNEIEALAGLLARSPPPPRE